MQERPAGVPKTARYSQSDGWWQVGEVKKGKPFGPWQTFRPDGSKLFEARFDAKGRLQGAFKRFHPDGSLAREATYAKGAPTGEHVYHRAKGEAGDFFPSADPRAWRVVIQHDDEGKPEQHVLFDEHGRELEAAEPEVAAGALDVQFESAQPDGYVANGLAAGFAALGKAEPAARRDDFLLPYAGPARRPLTPERYAELYGHAMPAPLRAWCAALAAGPKLIDVQPVRDGDLAVDGNLAEALIVEHQTAGGRTSALRELVSGALAIAEGEDTRFLVSLCETFDNVNPTDAVYTLQPRRNIYTRAVARSLDDFAFVVALVSAADAGAVSTPCLAKAYERLRGRVDLLHLPMRRVEARALTEEEDDEVVGDPAKDHREGFCFRRPNQISPYLFYRASWVLALLSGYGAEAAAAYEPKYQGELPDERFAMVLPRAAKEPWVAFYWLMRCWVFDDPRLGEMLRVCSDTPSRLVRDISELVGELVKGRKKIGDVDVQAAKRAFRAANPLANEEESEEDEDEDEDAEEQEEQKDKRPRLPIPPELASAAAILEWARKEGYSRENLLLKDEIDCAALGLALRADPKIVVHINELCDESWLGPKFLDPWAESDRAPMDVLLPAARRWLANPREAGVELCAVAAKIVARAGNADDAKPIAYVLERLFDMMWDRGGGFGAAMNRMEARETIPDLCEAVIRLGVPDDFVAALEAVVSSETHLVDDAKGEAALVLASMGRGLDPILAGLRVQLSKEWGHNVKPETMLAIGELGKREPEARRRELIAEIADFKRAGRTTAVARAFAVHDLGGGGDPVAALRAAFDMKGHSHSSTADDYEFYARLIGKRADTPTELLEPLVLDQHIEVHRAAVRSLRARGAAVPPFTLYDPLFIGELDRAALHEALQDARGLYRSNVALWLSEHPDPSSRDALVAAARRIMTAADFPSDGPAHYELRWIVRGLIRVGGAEDVLAELMMQANRNLGEPVLRYADQLGTGAAPGMVHVYQTDKYWKVNVAKQWLAKHRQDPAVVSALAEAGLTVEDVTRKVKDDE